FLRPGQSKKLALLSEILEMSRNARMVTDQSGKTILFNSKIHDLCPKQSVPSLNCLLSFFETAQGYQKHFDQLQKAARDGETLSLDIPLHKNGSTTKWYTITAGPISGWKHYTHWRVEDITTQKTQQEELSNEHEKLIDYTDNAPVGFFSVNQYGVFEFVNATLARWLGTDAEELVGKKNLHSFFVSVPDNAEPYDIKENGGVRQIAEVRMKSVKDREFLASITQTVVHDEDGKTLTRAVVNDLSAEQAIRQALQDSEDRFRQFFEEAPIGIAILDKENQIKECNPLLEKMVEKEQQSVQFLPFTEIIDYADWPLATETLAKIRSGEILTDPIEIRLWEDQSKTPLPCHMFARMLSEGDNMAVHFLDLSQQKSLENQFIQSQKMQAVGQLAGGIAHDFNNLLTAIIGFCDLLLLRHKPGDPSFGDIQQIKQNSNRAANLVRQLLAFSRQQTLRPQIQDVTDILTEVAHLLRRLIGVNIDLDLVHGNDLWPVKVDSGQMEQVFVNLVVNARDAMPDGGALTITTTALTTTESMSFGQDTMPAGEWTKIEIKDSGTGIPPDVLEHIFEPFFTTKEVGKGTGLGLATVYGIIRQTGGYLGVDSIVGEGTSFSIYLPRVREEEKDQEKHPEQTEETSTDLTGNARIMLVEDEDAVRTFSTRALTNKGYEVITAENGDAGLEVFQSLDKPIDLLITDVMMPGKDGPTLAKEIRESVPDLKIIFISGYTEERLKDTLGDNIYFLPKPFTLKDLASKVKEVLQG
ncbi:MAG TPA: response regulator, partial [Alphaproteobacteria bacterium]|nr:response regulator [Alphaproteobacteria bacterium]